MVDVGRLNTLGTYSVTATHHSPSTGSSESQSINGAACDVAGAWLRALADRIDPPQKGSAPSPG